MQAEGLAYWGEGTEAGWGGPGHWPGLGGACGDREKQVRLKRPLGMGGREKGGWGGKLVPCLSHRETRSSGQLELTA